MRLPPWDPDEHDREIKRLREVDRRERGLPKPKAARGRGPLMPTPKLQPNGRWYVKFQHQREQFFGAFDTKEEAQAYINQVKGVSR